MNPWAEPRPEVDNSYKSWEFGSSLARAFARIHLRPSKPLMMGEPIGLGLGILPIFSTCLEYFHLFKAAQSSTFDCQVLLLKLDFEHERFIIWGEKHGVFQDIEPRSHEPDPDLGRHVNYQKVMEALRLIKALFENAENLSSLYGVCASNVPDAEAVRERWKLAFPSTSALRRLHWRHRRPEHQDETTQKFSILKKTRWAINDKSKFESLIRDIRHLVDGLYAILPVSDKDRDRAAIQDIVSLLPDLARLKLIEAASEEAYPAWSGAASGVIIEASQLGSTRRGHETISEWVERVGDAPGVEYGRTVEHGSADKSLGSTSGKSTESPF